MDLITLENTSQYAIESVYRFLWEQIPEKYKLPEDDRMINDMMPFYDPELTLENRLQYKLTNVNYPVRSKPWFVITWNTQNGLLKSSLTQRRLQTTKIETEKYGDVKCKFINTELQINFGIASNSMSALFELQEYMFIHFREKMTCETRKHPILGNFPVSLDVLDSNQSKLNRDKGTLCYLFLQCKIDYPIIGFVEKITNGIIKEIHMEVDGETNTEQPYVYSRDIIYEE